MTENEEQVESSSHLNNECFLVAGWEVSPDTLRIKKGDKSSKIEPKVMQVLVMKGVCSLQLCPQASRRSAWGLKWLLDHRWAVCP